jgi:hypothetical protein
MVEDLSNVKIAKKIRKERRECVKLVFEDEFSIIPKSEPEMKYLHKDLNLDTREEYEVV